MPRRYSNIFTDRINSFNNTDYHKQFWTGFRIFFTTSIISEVGFFQKPFDNLFDPYTQNDDSISSYSGFTFLKYWKWTFQFNTMAHRMDTSKKIASCCKTLCR